MESVYRGKDTKLRLKISLSNPSPLLAFSVLQAYIQITFSLRSRGVIFHTRITITKIHGPKYAYTLISQMSSHLVYWKCLTLSKVAYHLTSIHNKRTLITEFIDTRVY
jgi:hypothetical protein